MVMQIKVVVVVVSPFCFGGYEKKNKWPVEFFDVYRDPLLYSY